MPIAFKAHSPQRNIDFKENRANAPFRLVILPTSDWVDNWNAPEWFPCRHVLCGGQLSARQILTLHSVPTWIVWFLIFYLTRRSACQFLLFLLGMTIQLFLAAWTTILETIASWLAKRVCRILPQTYSCSDNAAGTAIGNHTSWTLC